MGTDRLEAFSDGVFAIAITLLVLEFLNLLLVLFVAFLPFPTGLLAEHIREQANATVAAAAYSGTMFCAAIAWNLLWRWIVRDARLLHAHIDPESARATRRRFALGIPVYGATIGLSFVSGIAALIVHGLLAVYYVIDQLPLGRTEERTG